MEDFLTYTVKEANADSTKNAPPPSHWDGMRHFLDFCPIGP